MQKMEPSAESDTELASPGAMRELIQYFETHGRFLDRQELVADVSASQSGQLVSSFVSCIRFNGIPILPPVMTSSRRDEVLQDKKKAVFQDNRRTARQSRHLVERAHSLLQSAEARHPSDTRTGRTTSAAAGSSSRLALDRPLVLRPVVTSAWGSVTASGSTSTSLQSLDSASVEAPSSLAANTFATAEQGNQEEFGLQTLDSLCSDFMSLEETLPTDFNGVPLTSVRQQKISHDLLRLSKILKVRDMNSTGGSDISDLPLSEYAGQGVEGSEDRVKGSGRSALDAVLSSFCHESQDTVVEASGEHPTGERPAGDNSTSGFMDNSREDSPAELSSLQGEGNAWGAGSSANTSGMSSANTTDSHRSNSSNRSSPRSNLKNNTVHFASFVTEYIDTSASLSSENITVVKKKLPGDRLAKDRSEVKGAAAAPAAISLLTNKEAGQDLLSNVSLTEPDSPLALTPPSLPPSSLPFQSYMKTDPSSSDKENDSGQSNKLSVGSVSGSLQSGLCPKLDGGGGTSKSGRGSGVSDSQGSCKSDATATTSESSNSTLIEDAAAAAASQDSITTGTLPLNIVGCEEGAAGKPARDSQKSGGATAPHKPKRLPPEPPQESYQRHSSRQRTLSGGDKDSAGGKKKEASDSSFHKGHIRRGSYTLVEPSPALLRSQVMGGTEGSEDRTDRGEGKHKEGEVGPKPLNIPLQSHVPSEPEAAGKAEHINKYLSQVQLHNSEDLTASQLSADLSQYGRVHVDHNNKDDDDDAAAGMSTNHHQLAQSSFSILQSLTSSSHGGVGDSTTTASSSSGGVGAEGGAGGGEAVQKFQTLRQTLMESQQKDLEELFVQQRKEQMLLQAEIEEHQRRMKEQQEFLASNAPENIKVPSQRHNGELSPDSSMGSCTHAKHFAFPLPPAAATTTTAGLGLHGHGHSGQEGHFGHGHRHGGHGHGGQASGGGGPMWSQKASSHQTGGGGGLLLNTSVASSSPSPKVKRPVMRSPVKFYPGHRPLGQVIVPPQAYEPDMQVKFDKLTAAARGFLCRRLLHSDKVQDLVKTIKDTREFAFSFQSETPIRQGTFSTQDRTLLERIVAQLQAALLDVHEIFFDTLVAEQMSLIEQTRINNREKRIKSSLDEVAVRTSAPRISTATLKAQERRRRAQEAESAVFGSSITRPRTAPSATTTSPRSQASIDLSGPLRRHYQSLLFKAMKPAAMHASHQHSHPHSARPESSRSEMERPQTAPERSSTARAKRTSSGSHGQAGSLATESGQPRFNIRPKASQQPGSQSGTSKSSAKATKSSSKSWR